MKSGLLDIMAFQTTIMPYSEAMDYLVKKVEHEVRNNSPDFIVLPEKWISDILPEDSDELSGLLDYFCSISRETGAAIIPGSLSVQRENGLFNSSPVIVDGKTAGWQDKVSLFRREKEKYAPGRSAMTFKYGHLKFAVSVCYDSDFPYYTRMAALNGAEIMINPALIHGEFHDMWKIYIEARSLENRMPFISVNSLSEPFRGGSMFAVPVRYMFGAKLKTESFGEATFIHRAVDTEGLLELREERLLEDPGSYGFK